MASILSHYFADVVVRIADHQPAGSPDSCFGTWACQGSDIESAALRNVELTLQLRPQAFIGIQLTWCAGGMRADLAVPKMVDRGIGRVSGTDGDRGCFRSWFQHHGPVGSAACTSHPDVGPGRNSVCRCLSSGSADTA
jgi:hypothetical protein